MIGYLPIADHGLIGDLHSVALVGTNRNRGTHHRNDGRSRTQPLPQHEYLLSSIKIFGLRSDDRTPQPLNTANRPGRTVRKNSNRRPG